MNDLTLPRGTADARPFVFDLWLAAQTLGRIIEQRDFRLERPITRLSDVALPRRSRICLCASRRRKRLNLLQLELGRAVVGELAQAVKLVACDIAERRVASDHAPVASHGVDGLGLIKTTVRLAPPSVGV